MVQEADEYYYGKNKPLMTDEEYDILREWSRKLFQKMKLLQKVMKG